MFAFIAVDPEGGDEGVVGVMKPNGEWVPLVGADMDRVVSLKPVAKQIARQTGREITIRYFANVVDMEKITP